MNHIVPLAIIMGLISINGCSDNQETASATNAPAPAADPHAGLMGVGAPTGNGPTAISGSNQGTVKQLLQAGGYTYLEVATSAKGDVWIATNHTENKIGDTIAWKDGAVMRNFKSKILEREFPAVMFVSGLISPDELVKSQGTVGVVVSVQSAGGYTYIEADTEQGRIWLAITQRPIEQGSRIRWSGGAMMSNFHSKALDRDFDQILFISDIQKG